MAGPIGMESIKHPIIYQKNKSMIVTLKLRIKMPSKQLHQHRQAGQPVFRVEIVI